MTDQNSTTYLGLDDELRVLEAIYKKNPQVLRPDQIKKLMDSGRIFTSAPFLEKRQASNISTNQGIINKTTLEKSYDVVDQILMEMDECRSSYYSDDEWNTLSVEGKYAAREKMFENLFHISPIDLGKEIYVQLSRGGVNARN